MKMIAKILLIIVLFSTTLSGIENPRVLIQTELGDITAEIDIEKAPSTATNFLRYVDEKRYEGSSFYRVVTMDNQPKNDIKIEVIQGGLGSAGEEKRLPPIEHETTFTTGIKHEDGVISMARSVQWNLLR